jgi:ribosome-dependent ATPase
MLPPGSPAAEVADVSHRYGRTHALDQVSVAVPSNRLVGLVGPDGVGKSTLLALVSGARRLQTGRVTVLGREMGNASHRRQLRGRIAYMPQGLGQNLYPDLTVSEHLRFFGRLFGMRADVLRSRRDSLLQATGLSGFEGRRARHLSGGMKQKLALCCALMPDPELLILDEPTTGVDPLSRRHFWELIRGALHGRPALSVLVATAYMEEAEHFDSLVVMNAGRVIAQGVPARLEEEVGVTSLPDAYARLTHGAHAPVTAPGPPSFSARFQTAAVEAVSLTRSFGSFTAVSDVSFRIDQGEVFGFIGPNGSGKTTTMKMLVGLLPASSGRALMLGEAVDPHSLAQRHRLGYMSQSFSLYGDLTVEENILLHGRLYRLPSAVVAEKLEELSERFELGRWAPEVVAGLPVGVRQRLALAVAVLHQPEVLILDEPTSGVDPAARDAFWDLIHDLARRQRTTVFVSTHYLSEAARCDRVALMHEGRLLACGAPSDLVAGSGAADLEDAFARLIEGAGAEVRP